jgi:hypothetical protein
LLVWNNARTAARPPVESMKNAEKHAHVNNSRKRSAQKEEYAHRSNLELACYACEFRLTFSKEFVKKNVHQAFITSSFWVSRKLRVGSEKMEI